LSRKKVSEIFFLGFVLDLVDNKISDMSKEGRPEWNTGM
jgi:hypothetical protein